MEYGICHLGIIPGRADASDKAEMVTQLLFGEHFQVLEQSDQWIRIKTAHDNYECWICDKQWMEITHDDYDHYSINDYPTVSEKWTHITHRKSGVQLPVSCGAILPNFQNGRFRIRNEEYQYTGNVASKAVEDFESIARSLLNTPYLWGGRGPLGIDCSGFSQLIYRQLGHSIPRDAYQQAEQGEPVDFSDLVEPGDLVFFDNDEGKINHVGLVLEKGKVIHASGKVRIDILDHHGLYADDHNKYTHKMRIIKRILKN
jgi:gamma-D-glutamyl-L-lysine dipeptidyl-peptidase